MKRRLFIVLSLASLLLFNHQATACNIPVFRYALEHWRADSLELLLFHNQPLSVDDNRIVSALTKQSNKAGGQANFEVITVDASTAAAVPDLYAGVLELARQSQTKNADLMCVLVSKHGRGLIPQWIGTLDQVADTSAFRSPACQKAVKRLLAGDSAVWLVRRGQDDKESDRFSASLAQSLQALSTKLKLPDGIGLPGSELHSEIPLLLQFSVIEFDFDDANEQLLSTLCRSLQPDAVEAGQSIAIPVFGRGRVLEVIPAADLSETLIEDLTIFLCGACSCQVKERNPGFDLLLATDWETELFGEGGVTPPEKLKANPSRRDQPPLLKIPPGRRPR